MGGLRGDMALNQIIGTVLLPYPEQLSAGQHDTHLQLRDQIGVHACHASGVPHEQPTYQPDPYCWIIKPLD